MNCTKCASIADDFDWFILGAAANYMTPYTYTTLPQSAGMAAVAAANGIHGLSPYQGGGGAALQEARLQWYPKRLCILK